MRRGCVGRPQSGCAPGQSPLLVGYLRTSLKCYHLPATGSQVPCPKENTSSALPWVLSYLR